MMGDDFDLSDAKRRMDSGLTVFKEELTCLRSGRASTRILESIVVDAYGSRSQLSQVASVSVMDSRTLSVSVWDSGLVGAVERAIRGSKLGLNPVVSGTAMRVPLPELSADRRKELVKIAQQSAEQARVVMRNIRRDVLDKLRKSVKEDGIGEDEGKRDEGRVQKLTDEYISEIDQLLAAKEQEIKQV